MTPLVQSLVLATTLTGQRPAAVGVVESRHLPVRVHYQAGVTEEHAKEILEISEISWDRMFREMGFRAPLADFGEGGSDAYDVYVVTDLPNGVGGYTGFSGFDESTTRADAYGYTVVADDLRPQYIRGVVAHELFHASQMAYDWWEHISFMEGSSTWIVDQVFPDEDFYWRYFTYYNKKPWQALNFISLADPYQYGTGMFLTYLDEKYGEGDGAFLREVWEHAEQDDFTNEPDYLDVMDEMLEARGGLKTAFHEFAEWRLIVGTRDDGEHFREGGTWTELIDPWLDFDGAAPGKGVQTSLVQPLQPFSHAFIRLTSMADGWSPVRFRAETEEVVDARIYWTVLAEGLRCEGEGMTGRSRAEASVDPTCGGRLAAGAPREVLIALSHFGDEMFDADTSTWHPTPYRWRLTPEKMR